MSLIRTRHQETVESIAGWILGGRLGAGSLLPREDDIGAELGVSRTVVREAMRTLVAKGMVIVRRRHGTQVTPADSWSLFDPQVVEWRLKSGLTRDFIEDLIQFRLGIEPLAGGLAAGNPKFPGDELLRALAQMSAAVDGQGDYHQADLTFHRIILLGSNNQFLRQLAPLMANALRISFQLSVLSMDSARASLPMHRAVAEAIIGHDAKGASSALSKLIGSAREDILIMLARQNGEGLYEEGDRLSDPGP